jgi:hypothetical protein
MSQTEGSAWDRVIRPWWAKLAIGLLMVVLAVISFNRYSRIESGEENAPTIVSAREQFLYDVGGKWLVAGLFAAGGFGFLGWGGYQVSRWQTNAQR